MHAVILLIPVPLLGQVVSGDRRGEGSQPTAHTMFGA